MPGFSSAGQVIIARHVGERRMDLVRDTAVITDEAPEAEKKPAAKKPAAKKTAAKAKAEKAEDQPE